MPSSTDVASEALLRRQTTVGGSVCRPSLLMFNAAVRTPVVSAFFIFERVRKKCCVCGAQAGVFGSAHTHLHTPLVLLVTRRWPCCASTWLIGGWHIRLVVRGCSQGFGHEALPAPHLSPLFPCACRKPNHGCTNNGRIQKALSRILNWNCFHD